MSLIQPLLEPLLRGEDIPAPTLQEAITSILRGDETPVLISALLIALRCKGETASDTAAAMQALLSEMIPLRNASAAMDIVGTGGDGHYTLNISTTTAIIVASCGVPVAKHGNRAASSISGASDVLSALGVQVELDHNVIRRSLQQANIAFMWAPLFHPGMRFAGPVRSEIKIKTLFNFIGPLCNPARVKRMLLGCASAEKLPMMVQSLQKQGAEKVWGVHGDLGLDEISITGANRIVALEDGKIREFSLHPHHAGLNTHSIDSIRGGTPEENAAALRRLLQGESGGYRDMVLLNAAAALKVADRVTDLPDGVAMAAQAIDNGNAEKTLETLIAITQSPAQSE